jgi:hypothetical protein
MKTDGSAEQENLWVAATKIRHLEVKIAAKNGKPVHGATVCGGRAGRHEILFSASFERFQVQFIESRLKCGPFFRSLRSAITKYYKN